MLHKLLQKKLNKDIIMQLNQSQELQKLSLKKHQKLKKMLKMPLRMLKLQSKRKLNKLLIKPLK